VQRVTVSLPLPADGRGDGVLGQVMRMWLGRLPAPIHVPVRVELVIPCSNVSAASVQEVIVTLEHGELQVGLAGMWHMRKDPKEWKNGR
jgi:hypothetical protein